MARPKPPAAALMASPDDIEQQFYEALQRGDIDKLMATWSDDDEITCVHPGGPRVIGAAAIRTAFETLMAGGEIHVQPEKVRRMQTQTSAVHTVVERVRMGAGDGAQVIFVIATNVYMKTAQGWRMVAHHASPAFTHEVADVGDVPAVLH